MGSTSTRAQRLRLLLGVAEPIARRATSASIPSSYAETPTSLSDNLLSIARRALLNDRNRLHFDQEIWVGQAPHFDRGTGGEGPKVLHPDVHMLEELVNVCDIRGRLHQ